jgi:carbon-monoxide dehydrogenase medium subunit
MLPRFGYLRAVALDDALMALRDYGAEARVLAGGTDLFVSMKDGLASPRYLVDVKHIRELRRITVGDDGSLTIGACVTVNQILDLKSLPRGMDALRQAASWLGTNQVRNRATVGGNLCNASPACDLAPALLVLGATVRVSSAEGERVLDLKDLFKCPKQTCLAAHELVTQVVVPPAPETKSAFMKRQRIRGHDLAVVNAAAAVDGEGELKMAVGAVAPRPLLLDRLGNLDGGGQERRAAIVGRVLEAISPIDDVRSSGAYRRLMVAHLVGELLAGLEQ